MGEGAEIGLRKNGKGKTEKLLKQSAKSAEKFSKIGYPRLFAGSTMDRGSLSSQGVESGIALLCGQLVSAFSIPVKPRAAATLSTRMRRG